MTQQASLPGAFTELWNLEHLAEPQQSCNFRCLSDLNPFRLHVFSEAQLIQLLCVRYAIVAHNWVCQRQDLTSVAGVSQSLGVPKAKKLACQYCIEGMLKQR